MSELLPFTMFQRVLFPVAAQDNLSAEAGSLVLNRVIRFQPAPETIFRDATLLFFDFETTGLDPREDRIIEIGAQKIVGGKVVGEFHTLVNPEIAMTASSSKITGITAEMLAGQPTIETTLPKFLDFMQGSILAAHNADFDMSFLAASAQRLGYQLQWPCFCTLKMARALLPQLESKSLDALAQHFGLQFEARHRSIGDVKVTHAVLAKMLALSNDQFTLWQDFDAFKVA